MTGGRSSQDGWTGGRAGHAKRNTPRTTRHTLCISTILNTMSCIVMIMYTRCKYFDPCYARATVVRARFLAAAFSDGSYLAHVNGAYLRHVTFCIVRALCSSPRLSLSVGPLAYAARCPLTVPGWSKVHDGDFEGVEQTCSRIQPASPILV